MSAFLRIQVLSKQALASLRMSSIILCATSMENIKPHAPGITQTLIWSKPVQEVGKYSLNANYFCICHSPAFFPFPPFLRKGKNRIPRELPWSILKTAYLEGKSGTQHIKACSNEISSPILPNLGHLHIGNFTGIQTRVNWVQNFCNETWDTSWTHWPCTALDHSSSARIGVFGEHFGMSNR